MLRCVKELESMKHVSIIIPVLDEEKILESSLNSLQILRKNNCEIIVVDGGSSDRSPEIAKPRVDKFLVTRPGRAHQMNFGAEHSKGKILVFLHADSQISSQAISQLVKKTDSLNYFWGWFRLTFDSSSPTFALVSFFMMLRSKITKICTGDQTLFISSGFFNSIGGFPSIPIMEDVAISKILRVQAVPIELKIKTLSSTRRWKQEGIYRTIVFMWYLRLLYWLGVSPNKLVAKYYPKKIEEGYIERSQVAYKYSNIDILLFARLPVLGKVKTRLRDALSETEILALYEAMFKRVAGLLDESRLAQVQLWLDTDPAKENEFVLDLPGSFKINEQIEGDLGEKMNFAINKSLVSKDSEYALLLGSDCPAMTYDYLNHALCLLSDGNKLVLGPAEDGGYVLIGVNKSYPELFQDINWGTNEVLEKTIQKAINIGIDYVCLEPLWDLDRPDDLRRLSELEPSLKWVN